MYDLLLRSYKKEASRKAAPLTAEFLGKVASGKLSCFHDEGSADWAEKFRGTPLFGQAIALMQQQISNDMQQAQEDMARNSNASWLKRDQIRNQMKLLDLQFLQMQDAQQQAPDEQLPMVGPATDGSQSISPGQSDLKTAGAKETAARWGERAGYMALAAGAPAAAAAISKKLGPKAEQLITKNRASGSLDRLSELVRGSRVDKLEHAADIAERLPPSVFGSSAEAIRGEANKEVMKGLLARGGLLAGGAAIPLAMQARKEQAALENPDAVLGPKLAELRKAALGMEGAMNAMGKTWGKLKGNTQTGALIGAGLGAAGGALSGDKDTSLLERVGRGALGGVAGGLAGATAGNYANNAAKGIGGAMQQTMGQASKMMNAGVRGYHGTALERAGGAIRDVAGSAADKLRGAADTVSQTLSNSPAASAAGMGALAGAGAAYAPKVKGFVDEVRNVAKTHPGGTIGAVKSLAGQHLPGALNEAKALVSDPNRIQSFVTQVGTDIEQGKGLMDTARNAYGNFKAGIPAAASASQVISPAAGKAVDTAEELVAKQPLTKRLISRLPIWAGGEGSWEDQAKKIIAGTDNT